MLPVTGNCHNFCSALLSSDTKHPSLSLLVSLFIFRWHCTWARSPPEAAEGLSCYHGNPCLAADLLCAKGGREKGRSGGRKGTVWRKKRMQMRSQGWFQDSGQRHMVVGCCLWTPCFSTARVGCTRRGAAQEMLLELVHSRVLGFLGVIPTQHPLSTAPCRVLVLQHRHLLGCPLGEAALLLAKESGCWIQAPECMNANSPPRTSVAVGRSCLLSLCLKVVPIHPEMCSWPWCFFSPFFSPASKGYSGRPDSSGSAPACKTGKIAKPSFEGGL